MSNNEGISITDDQYKNLKYLFKDIEDDKQLFKLIVNGPFTDRLLATSIDLGIVVLLLVNVKDRMVDRVSLSDTELALGAVKASARPFSEIRIPLKAKNNIIVQAIDSQEYQATEDWKDLFVPALTPEQARRNQVSASIECSFIKPFSARNGGALIFSFYQPVTNIMQEHHDFISKYTTMVSEQLQAGI